MGQTHAKNTKGADRPRWIGKLVFKKMLLNKTCKMKTSIIFILKSYFCFLNVLIYRSVYM